MSRWPYPRIVAHRGGGTLAPENTLGAIRFGASRGFVAVEVDVMLAGDGVPVLIHDRTLERTTHTRGMVSATPLAALERLDAGAWFSAEWRGERIPRFEDAARLCRELGLWVKSGATSWQTLQAATKHAAEVSGVGEDVGTVEAGKLADLIVVRDNPLDDIDNVRTLELVFKGGRLVADHRVR